MSLNIIHLQSLDEGIKVYSSLTERQLRRFGDDQGIFIAESPKVISVALKEGYEPVSLLCEQKHINGDAAQIIAMMPGLPVYTGERELLSELTGYSLTRGVLCAMKRKKIPDPYTVCRNKKIIAVIEGVCDTTNIGSVFRSAAALGLGGILLTPDSCDPLNRRSIRVSMGSVFKIPWTFTDDPISILKGLGYTTVALALHNDALPIDAECIKSASPKAVFLGTEGNGLSERMIARCDYKAIIPMYYDVDSLNVGAAAAIAFWELGS